MAIPQKSREPWTPSDDAALLSDSDKGKSVDLLMLIHKRSRNSIENRLRKLRKSPPSLSSTSSP